STGSVAPRKAELGRAGPILIPRGGPRPWRSYQQSGAHRYAPLRFRRSHATVEGQVMRCCSLPEPAPRVAPTAGKVGQRSVAGKAMGLPVGAATPSRVMGL